MPEFSDYADLGFFPLQDHGQNVPVHLRQMLAGARISRMEDPLDAGSAKDLSTEIAEEDDKGTIGDIHPWAFLQTKERGDRGMGSWQSQFVGLVTEGSDGGQNAPTTFAGVGKSRFQPFRDSEYVFDDRFQPKELSPAIGLSAIPRGAVVMYSPGTDEAEPVDLVHNIDARLFAPSASGPGEAGTLVCDLQPDGEICAETAYPGVGGRSARLQSLVRVVPMLPLSGITPEPNILALNYGNTNIEQMAGLGAIYGPVAAARFGIPALPTSGAPPGQAAADGPKSPAEFGQFSQKARGGYGVAMMAHVGGFGPIVLGSGAADKHLLGQDRDGHPITSAHISTSAYFHRDELFDAPLAFEGLYKPASSYPNTARVTLAYDDQSLHGFKNGTRAGLWRWYCEVPYLAPTTTRPPTPGQPGTPGPQQPPPPGPPPPGTPITPRPTPGGPSTPAPGGPNTPGGGPGTGGPGGGPGTGGPGGIPLPPSGPGTGGIPGGDSLPIPGGKGPKGTDPAGKADPKPRLPGGVKRKVADVLKKSRAKIPLKLPGATPIQTQDDIPPEEEPIEVLPDLPPDGPVTPSGGGPTETDLPAGVNRTVGQSDTPGRYQVFHPMAESFAAVAFRPQLWILGAPNYENSPVEEPEEYQREEQTRPQVAIMRPWAAQRDGSWIYNEEDPAQSRARGGTARGGVLMMPPGQTMESYTGIGFGADDQVDELEDEACLAMAYGMCLSFGAPDLESGGMAPNSYKMGQPSSETNSNKPLTIAGVDSTGAGKPLISMELDQSTGDRVVHFNGEQAFRMPVGNDATRPASPSAGMMRANNQSGTPVVEFYDGSSWGSLGGGGGGVTDHGALTGLGDDDHTQYLLADGTRAMGGALAMGGNRITGLAAGAVATDAITVGQALGALAAKVNTAGSTMTGNLAFNDGIRARFGTGGDADIYYNGTDLVVAPAVVGSGKMSVAGRVNAETGYEYDSTIGATVLLEFEDGLGNTITINVQGGIITSLETTAG